MSKPIHMARNGICRKLRPTILGAVKGCTELLGLGLLLAGTFLAIGLLLPVFAFIWLARILVVPAIVAMLIAATLYLLGVVP